MSEAKRMRDSANEENRLSAQGGINATLNEMRDRLRRVETRFTAYLQAQGFDTQATKPKWDGVGCVVIPNMNSTLKDILRVVPVDYLNYDVDVYHKGRRVICFSQTFDAEGV